MKLNLNSSSISEPAGVLNYFTQSPILRQIGHRRLARLLNPFAEDLKAARLVLPEPDPQNDDYFADLANALSIADRLPARLRQTLLTIELAASPENEMPLWRVINRRLPGVSVSQDCALDCALDLWFLAPDEFSQFVPPALHLAATQQSEGGSFSEGGSPPASTIQPFNVSTGLEETEDQTYDRLSRLAPGEYDRARQAEATRLGIRKETLDTEVARRRPLSDDAQGRAVHLPAVEPWPEPVNLALVLDEVSAR